MNTISKSKAFGAFDSCARAPMVLTYCKCGAIVDLDKSFALRKVQLGKEVECPACRNMRISNDIDFLNDHYNNVDINCESL